MQNNSSKSSGSQPKKENLKSKLDGNELDLSLSSLEVVPVKELAEIPKATCLDLSCNLLFTLGDDFPTLTHLVKLDLSKNKLTSLPDNFGNLRKLQHLDLYNNSLTLLPLSFARLSALKWLDLRDNPLDPSLAHQAGECLNEAQCRTCAKQVVEFMKKWESEAERVKQRRLKEEREREAAIKKQEEQEKQKAQQVKKAERERRKKEQETNRQQAASSAARLSESDNNDSAARGSTDVSKKSRKVSKKRSSEKGGCISWCFEALVMAALFLAGVLITVTLYCYFKPESTECTALYEQYWPQTVSLVRLQLNQAWNLTSLAYNRTLEMIGQKTI